MADDDPGEASTVIPEAGGKAKVLPGKNAATRQKILVASGVAGLILTVLILRSRSSSASNASAPATTAASGAVDPTTGVPYEQELSTAETASSSAIDPLTGQPYATELATAQGQAAGLSAALEGYTGGTGVTPTSSSGTGGSGVAPTSQSGISGGHHHGRTGHTAAAS